MDRSCRLLHGQPRQPFKWNYFPLLTGRIVLSNKKRNFENIQKFFFKAFPKKRCLADPVFLFKNELFEIKFYLFFLNLPSLRYDKIENFSIYAWQNFIFNNRERETNKKKTTEHRNFDYKNASIKNLRKCLFKVNLSKSPKADTNLISCTIFVFFILLFTYNYLKLQWFLPSL